MNVPIGFVILSHSHSCQLLRLIDRLNVMFAHPPIVCHHDFYQCSFEPGVLPANVSFVTPHLQTAWAHFSIVEATIRAFDQICKSSESPDWIVLLSGNDYPIKSTSRILSDLNSNESDALMHCELIHPKSLKTTWHKSCYGRYCNSHDDMLALSEPKTPKATLFSNGFNCYAGSQWFSARRHVVEYIVKFHKMSVDLFKHYAKSKAPDESYFHTIVANTVPPIKIDNNNWRYIDWSKGGAHPKTLVSSDLPHLLTSPAHFARKFNMNIDVAILDQLDEITA
jgi:hypothetical protein